jgi:N-acetylmuramoyl-L-alanine amidase
LVIGKSITFVSGFPLKQAVNKRLFLHIYLLLASFFLSTGIQAAEKVFTVVVDAGHGGKDPGARGANTNEKEINLAVALKLGKKIADTHKDVKVIYTRETDKFIDLDERANIANRNKADLFISIHTNAVERGTVRGTETYTLGLARSNENLQVAMRENSAILLEDNYLQKYEGFDPNSTESYIIFEFMQNRHMDQSIAFASEIQKSFTASAKRADRGVRQAGFLVLRKTSMPSVLVELGYISNRDEERYMKSAAGQQQLVDAMCEAFMKFKREYDRKQGTLAITPLETPGNATAVNNVSGAVVYKIQILTSDKELATNARELKGYKNVECYVENGKYKYTYGAAADLDEIRKLRQTVVRDFRDAFIISFKDGKRVTN